MPPRRVRWSACRARSTAGQATVEFALVVPLVAILLLALVQGALVVRDQVLTVNAAREAAREASVGGSDDRIDAAAARVLDGTDAEVTEQGDVGEPVVVRVQYESKTNVPLIGPLLPDIALEATATMRAEK